jgi:methylase of polypeptide subunit release factors
MFLENYLSEDAVAIDATVGNGNDTLYLSDRCKFVYGFDVQETAINNTKEKLTKDNVKLILDGHEKIMDYVKEDIDIAVFNLGYLPKGDKSLITKKDTTITAIESSMELLKKGGIILIAAYYGHDGGLEEKNAVEEYITDINEKEFAVSKYNLLNRSNNPPILYLIEKNK